jgi:hypothetical protein
MILKAKFFGGLVAFTITFVIQNPVYAIPIPVTSTEGIWPAGVTGFTLVSPDPMDSTRAFLESAAVTKINDVPQPFGFTGADFFGPSPNLTLEINREGTIVFPLLPDPNGVFVKYKVDDGTKLIQASFLLINTEFALSHVEVLVPMSLVIPGKPCIGTACNHLILQGEETVVSEGRPDDFQFQTKFFRVDLFGPELISQDPLIGLNFSDIIESGGSFSSLDFPDTELTSTFIESWSDTIFQQITLAPEPSGLSLVCIGVPRASGAVGRGSGLTAAPSHERSRLLFL